MASASAGDPSPKAARGPEGPGPGPSGAGHPFASRGPWEAAEDGQGGRPATAGMTVRGGVGQRRLKVDPTGNEAIACFTWRDLLGLEAGTARALWALPEPIALIRRQGSRGSWSYPGRGGNRFHSSAGYAQMETFRNLEVLVEKHAFTKDRPEGRPRG